MNVDDEAIRDSVMSLRVLQYRGMSSDITWHWLSQRWERIGLDLLLQKLGELSPDILNAANRCNIVREGDSNLSTWWFFTSDTEYNCLFNSRLLAPAHRVRLSDGDEIELGMVRLAVEFPGVSSSRQTVPGIDDVDTVGKALSSVAADPARLRSYAADVAEKPFSLTDLLTRHGRAINTLSPDAVSGAELETMFARIEGSGSQTARTAISAHIDQRMEAALLTDPDVEQDLPSDDETVQEVSTQKTNDLLAQLHEQYLFRLHNPHVNQAQHWSEVEQTRQSERYDEFANLKALSGTGSVHEVLELPEIMSDLLESYSSFNDNNLLRDDAVDNIMQLLAPEEFKRRELCTHQDTTADLPHLTRREHHDLSLDSSINMSSVSLKNVVKRVNHG